MQPVSLGELEAEITELAGHLNAATYRWLTLIAEFDRRCGWNDGALHSCAHWLNFKCGLDLGAAREKVRVAHALPALPQISAAMERGQLSYSKVRALTRVATPATEEYLLMIALHGTAHHVEALVRGYRRAQEAEELSRDALQQETRSLSAWFDADGSLVLRARLPALAGAMVMQALEAARERLPRITAQSPEAAEPVHRDRQRADALALMAEAFLQDPERDLATADRHQIVVHVDAETLRTGGAGRCEIEHGPSLPVETVRRLGCDASLVLLREDAAGEPLDVGRKTRSIPPAIRRALNARDRGCRFPGCTHARHLDAHHVEHWAHGGTTNMHNLIALCRYHHRRVHEDGVTIERLGENAYRFVRADGRPFDGTPADDERRHAWQDIRVHAAERGIDIDPDTAATRWRGERMDYELAVDVLFQQQARADRVSAETRPRLPEADA